MNESQDNPRRTLGHLRRLRRDGKDLINTRPLDEIAHAMWCDRMKKYLQRKMPDVRIPPPHELVPVNMPNLLAPDYHPSHPIDAAFRRATSGGQLVQAYLTILASAIERFELEWDTDGK